MKKFKIILCIFSFLILTSCSKSKVDIKNFYGKNYSAVGSSLSISKKSKSYSCLEFNLHSDVKFKDESKENLSGGFFDYPKIVKKGNKKFLTADNLPEDRFLIVSENKILDNYTGIELSFYEKEKNKEIEKFYNSLYEGPLGGKFYIVKKTDDYSLMAFSLPIDKNIKFKDENKDKKLSASLYDNPFIVNVDGKKFLMADNFSEKRFEILENKIVDTFTGYEFGIKNVSKK